jgi:hypothetical protein
VLTALTPIAASSTPVAPPVVRMRFVGGFSVVSARFGAGLGWLFIAAEKALDPGDQAAFRRDRRLSLPWPGLSLAMFRAKVGATLTPLVARWPRRVHWTRLRRRRCGAFPMKGSSFGFRRRQDIQFGFCLVC